MRISSYALQGQLDAALEEHRAAHHQFGEDGEAHWLLDMQMALIWMHEDNLHEAKRLLGEVFFRHGKLCSSVVCFSKLVPWYSGVIAAEEEDYQTAITFFNSYLLESSDDIIALLLRGSIFSELWEQEKESQYLQYAIRDLQSAHLLLGNIDDKVYVYKLLRVLENENPQAISNQCEAMRNAGIVESFTYGVQMNSANLDNVPRATANSVASVRMMVGYQLGCLLGTRDSFDKALALFNEVAGIARTEGECNYEVSAIGSIVLTFLRMHEVRLVRSDFSDLHKAESALADLLRIQNEQQLPKDLQEYIAQLETKLNNSTRR